MCVKSWKASTNSVPQPVKSDLKDPVKTLRSSGACHCSQSTLFLLLLPDYWESEERSIRGDWNPATIWTASKYCNPEGCKCNLWMLHWTVLDQLLVCVWVLSVFLPPGVWQWPVCVPGPGPAARRRAAGQSSDGAKVHRKRRLGHHLHTDQDCGVFTLPGGEKQGEDLFFCSFSSYKD